MAILCGDNSDIILKSQQIHISEKRHLKCVIHTKYLDGVNKKDTP